MLSSVLPTNWELVSEVLSHPREKQPDIIYNEEEGSLNELIAMS